VREMVFHSIGTRKCECVFAKVMSGTKKREVLNVGAE
jgi:hypothetical protein